MASAEGLPQKNLKIQVLICIFLASGYKIPRLSWLQKKQVFSGENFWFCAMNECLFWVSGENLVFCNFLCNERVPFLGKILV
jgi:hypothetical protein